MPGPKPKPSALKLISGNPGRRPINKHEPTPQRGIPVCPAHLSELSKATWARLAPMLDQMGVLTEADACALERLCETYSEIHECRDLIAKDGRTYTGRRFKTVVDDNGEKTTVAETLLKPNPAVAMLSDADRRFKSYLLEFGLTPSARSRIQAVPSDGAKPDPLDYFN